MPAWRTIRIPRARPIIIQAIAMSVKPLEYSSPILLGPQPMTMALRMPMMTKTADSSAKYQP